MKLFRLLPLILSISLFSSCEKEEMDTFSANQLSFSATTDQFSQSTQTRGALINSSVDVRDMAVFGYNTGNQTWEQAKGNATPGLFNNAFVEQTANHLWNYGSPKVWPLGNTTFFAYSPFHSTTNGLNSLTANDTKGAPTLSYHMPLEYSNQPDLMVGVMKKDLRSGVVNFEMKHALASIGFKVTGAGNNLISKIKFHNIVVESTLKLDYSGEGAPEWINSHSTSNEWYEMGIDPTIRPNSVGASITSRNGYLMAIPQDLIHGAEIIVTINGIDRTVRLTGNWEAGKKYIYNLNLQQPSLPQGSQFTVNGLNFKITNSEQYTVEVGINRNTAATVVIPESVSYNGITYQVTSIGVNAFKGNTQLEVITIPQSITTIGTQAFAGATHLGMVKTNIQNPSNVHLGSNVFQGIKNNAQLDVDSNDKHLFRTADQWRAFHVI